MPREARIKSLTRINHIMMRGINHQFLFEEKDPQYSGAISGVLTTAGGIVGMLMPLGMGVVSEHYVLKVGLFVPLVSIIIYVF